MQESRKKRDQRKYLIMGRNRRELHPDQGNTIRNGWGGKAALGRGLGTEKKGQKGGGEGTVLKGGKKERTVVKKQG